MCRGNAKCAYGSSKDDFFRCASHTTLLHVKWFLLGIITFNEAVYSNLIIYKEYVFHVIHMSLSQTRTISQQTISVLE